MEKAAMNKTADASRIYQPTANAPGLGDLSSAAPAPLTLTAASEPARVTIGTAARPTTGTDKEGR
jgi:hypothetical protein